MPLLLVGLIALAMPPSIDLQMVPLREIDLIQQSQLTAEQAKAEFDKMFADYQRDSRAFGATFDAIKDPEEQKKFDWSKSPDIGYVSRFRDLYERSKGLPIAPRVLLTLWQISIYSPGARDKEQAKKLTLEMFEKHPDSEHVVGMLGQVAFGYPFDPADARKVMLDLAKNPKVPEQTKDTITFGVGESCGRDKNATEAEIKSAVEALKALGKRKAGTPDADRANGNIFELTRLRIGMSVPDFEAVDLDGKSWKLSDYRGKVIVMDFYGLWCPPCVAMLPHLRKLNDNYGSKGMVLLGMNSDEPTSKLREALEGKGVNWRQAMLGSQKAPLPVLWNIQGWPSVFVVDAKGVIRYRHIRDKDLEEAVQKLLAEK